MHPVKFQASCGPVAVGFSAVDENRLMFPERIGLLGSYNVSFPFDNIHQKIAVKAFAVYLVVCSAEIVTQAKGIEKGFPGEGGGGVEKYFGACEGAGGLMIHEGPPVVLVGVKWGRQGKGEGSGPFSLAVHLMF